MSDNMNERIERMFRIDAIFAFGFVAVLWCVVLFVFIQIGTGVSEGSVRTVLMIAGGLLYTGGVAFYLWEKLPFHNTIWHIFVLTATFAFYAAVVLLVVSGTN